MKVAVLFSGGKDSNFALWKASKEHEVACLITLESERDDSYMFQSFGTSLTRLQSQALSIPQILKTTKGEKEEELEDLKKAVEESVQEYGVEGIVTGAIQSVYQASRIERICHELGLWCFNPLWQKPEKEFIRELVDNEFKVVIVGVFSYPFDKNWVGRILDESAIEELEKFENTIGINPAGEGGEFETLVLDSPIFNASLEITDASITEEKENRAYMRVNALELEEK